MENLLVNTISYTNPDLFSDVYFNKSKEVVETQGKKDVRVRYRVFFREDGIASGFQEAVKFIYDNTNPNQTKIWSLVDGQSFTKNMTVMIIEGLAVELLPLETIYLGLISFSGAATGMREIVNEANGVPVVDMSARHFPPQIIPGLAKAACHGGAIGTSTLIGFKSISLTEHKWSLFGSIPHALNAIFNGSSIEAAIAYQKNAPDANLTVLVDFEGREKDVIIEACKQFKDKLFAIRLDTHGGRVHQDGTENPLGILSDILPFGLTKELDKPSLVGYCIGKGVTIEEVKNARKWLDENGCQHTKIIVSSGFNAEKVKAFVKAEAPMDYIGTGSWVKFFQATSDIFQVQSGDNWINRTKVGRPSIDFDDAIKNLTLYTH